MNIGYLSTIYHTSFILKSPNNKFLDGIKTDLKWTLFPTGPAMMDAFKTGEIDAGYIGLPPVMIGINNGLKLKCVAGGHMEGTVMISKDSFYSFDDLGVVDNVLEQFEGENIGTPARGSIHDVIIRDLIQDLDITIINYSWADFIPGALDDGEIEAGLGTPSLAAVASREINSKLIIPASKLWPYNPSYGIVVREELIKREPEFINDFLMAHEAACNFIHNQSREAAEVVAGQLGNIDVDFILETFQISPKYCASLPEKYIISTLDFVPVLEKLGIWKRK